MSAPSPSLELRLELFKSISNAEFDFLQRLHGRCSVVERYLRRKIELHIHYLASGGAWCAKYRKFSIGRSRITRKVEDFKASTASECYEFPMLIFVRNRAQRSRPSAALVRLQQLKLCDMASVDSVEVSSLNPRSEVLSAVFDRKLRFVLGNSVRVEFSQFKNEIIEGSSQIVSDPPMRMATVIGTVILISMRPRSSHFWDWR
jgi:hypothetical protein